MEGSRPLSYLREFRVHWPTVLGACAGLALGSALGHYMLSLFGPALLDEFGWERSHFALIGTLSLVTVLAAPFAGRFIDRYGARKAAMVGFTVVPLSFIAYSLMTGEIWQFFAITVVKNLFGVLTGTMVFCRVVVERFDAARGIALSLVMSGAPLVSAIGVPLIGEVIYSAGWRAGYRLLAAMSIAGGLVAILLMNRRGRPDRELANAAPSPGRPVTAAAAERPLALLRRLVRQPVFLLSVSGMFLINIPVVIVISQMKLVLTESGAGSSLANWLITLYGASVVLGRFVCGLALDRIGLHLVAAFVLGLPALGFAGLASHIDASLVLAACIMLIGVAQGGEGDIAAFLTSRKFDLAHYSFVYSFLVGALGIATALGSVVLSFTLHLTGSYTLFLLLAAVLTVAGTAAFYFAGLAGEAKAESQPPHPA